MNATIAIVSWTSHSLGVMLRDLRLSCNGSLYARANILRGSLFPLEIRFSTFLRNGLLMYAFNGDVVRRLNALLEA